MEFFKKYAYVILAVVCVLALGGLFYVTNNRPSGVMDAGQPLIQPQEVLAETPEDTPSPEPTPEPTPEPAMIVVHVIGAVYSPGIIELPQGSRVHHALSLAGGHTNDADLSLINLAAEVHDAMQIRIPAYGEEPFVIDEGLATGTPQTGSGSPITADGRVNINLASLAELQTLPGIGATIAQNIIDYREAVGGFGSVDELINVNRIGSITLENIRDMVTIN